MPAHSLPPALIAEIERAVGGAFRARRIEPVGGGCSSRNFAIADDRRRYFLKVGRQTQAMFAAEADGLAALAQCPALAVPRVIAQAVAGEDAFLVLEWLGLQHQGDEARLGEAAAAMHEMRFPLFGWHCDNFIGSTPQANGWDDDWVRFYAERRLRPQLRLAAANGAPELAEQAEPILADLPRFFVGHAPTAGLLHGDLWSGNKGYVNGRPAHFDPAIYAGDGETDLAMAELFGGFSADFHAAYRAVRPLDAGYAVRRRLYQLYHLLNHYNLFGGAYGRQASRLIAGLESELR